MSDNRRRIRLVTFISGLSLVSACPFDTSLREYLSGTFWLPFAKRLSSFERPGIRRMDAPFAGMDAVTGDNALARLRSAYRGMSQAAEGRIKSAPAVDFTALIAAARSDPSLTKKQREEVDLLEAKIDLRKGEPDDDQLLLSARKKLTAFLHNAQSPEFLSEARGWLARVYYLSGDQTAAGKIYLDELNRNGSNLSRLTLLNSLSLNYGYDGGQDLTDHLDEYFDTPEHAAFAIQLITNPRWRGDDHVIWGQENTRFQRDTLPELYPRIKVLLAKHAELFRARGGSDLLAPLAMRTAIRMGDLSEARRIGSAVPTGASIRSNPDFNWMLASVHYLLHEYSAAEAPLLKVFRSSRSSLSEKAAAAYGLCGVYKKIGNAEEQVRYALWLHTTSEKNRDFVTIPAGLSDLSVYWAASGWDLGMLLDAESPIAELSGFVERNPGTPGLQLVKYSLAVRLARENRYREAADLYESVHSPARASRMRQMADLYDATRQPNAGAESINEARYKLAQFISANSERLYFNDALWSRMQRYAFQGATDCRLTRRERQQQIDLERRLKDDQEERWRAYLILRQIVQETHDGTLLEKSASLGLNCLTGLNERFGREREIRNAQIQLLRNLRHDPVKPSGM